MKEVRLTPRLMLTASFVGRDSVFADVGTDHAYLPIYLCQNEISRRGIASDIKSGPLKIAERNLGLAGMLGRVSVVLSDGLKNIDTESIDTVIIAGMGGDTICNILDGKSLDGRHNIILQPMTQVSSLRAYLAENKYAVVCEGLAEEENKIYHVLKVKKICRTIKLNDVELYVGTNYQNKNDSTYRKFLEKELERLQKIKNSLQNSKNANAKEKEDIQREYLAFVKAKEETK